MDEKSSLRVLVFYLVRKSNPILVFKNFIDSYSRHESGIDHTLILIYKGFQSDKEVIHFEIEASQIPHKVIFVSDIGFDLRAYFSAASATESELVCFINSYSRIEISDWLLKLVNNIKIPGVGLVGATGSWGTNKSRTNSGLKKNLWELLRNNGTPLYIRIFVKVISALFFDKYFPAFPNPHIRTNAFLMRRADFLALHRNSLKFKMQNYLLESGIDSLTNQILQKYSEVLVVDKNGVGYPVTEWPQSETFWSGSQQNLMISDNKTRKYTEASASEAKFLEIFAWGKNHQK